LEEDLTRHLLPPRRKGIAFLYSEGKSGGQSAIPRSLWEKEKTVFARGQKKARNEETRNPWLKSIVETHEPLRTRKVDIAKRKERKSEGKMPFTGRGKGTREGGSERVFASLRKSAWRAD